MCPFGFATVGCAVVGVVSTGGLAALAVKMSRMGGAVASACEHYLDSPTSAPGRRPRHRHRVRL
jgi:hypothetical protein